MVSNVNLHHYTAAAEREVARLRPMEGEVARLRPMALKCEKFMLLANHDGGAPR